MSIMQSMIGQEYIKAVILRDWELLPLFGMDAIAQAVLSIFNKENGEK